VKRGSIRLLSVAGFALITGLPWAAVAQSLKGASAQGDNCYMVTSSGRVVSLSKLCGGGKSPKGSLVPGVAPSNAASSVFQAKIKYRLGKTPVIDVTFNNNQTFEMVVDTGADGTLITRDMAKVMKLPITGVSQFEMADGRVVAMPLARVQSMSVNGAEVKNIEVAIADKTNIGLLGHDFFDNYDVKIKQNVVEFYRR
jgi:aspartyl protease family protein